jgi:hypothetical protein
MGAVASLLSLLTVGCLAFAAEGRVRKRPFALLLPQLASFIVLALMALLVLPGDLVARFRTPPPCQHW